ncbi:hypothetical protein CAPTEDRAFT_167269 [Capitella teleta]|uniref:Glutamate receptor n=1 Tax=Capitella teleta TaxID=283909 RepID=R7T932_CAPTE|nr:hypothetical protein CAPTEDRAFT_167269 [Capitella teleta]|eukprot:ELT90209.1 hypothetical protein CAPTEDRAFT_167269 [Capitella teleta]
MSFSETKRDGVPYHVGSDGLSCNRETLRPWRKGREIIDALKHVTFDGLTGFVAFDSNGRRANYTLMLWETTSYGFQEKGAWDSHNRTVTFRPANETFKRVQRENSTLIVTSILTEPYLMVKPGNYTGNDRFEGYCADLAKKVSEEVGLPYRIIPVADNKYGAQSENGTWDGMVGELIAQKADLAIAPLTITSVRERVIDFTKPFMKLGISIMLKKESAQNPGFFSFMYPLSTEIWVCVIFAYISVSVVLLLVNRGSADEGEEELHDKDAFTVSDSLWFALGAFMQQGTDKEPRSVTERLAGSVWWFFTLILISSYTANLAAFLTVARMKTAVNSADDLAKQTEIKYGTVTGGSTEEFFQTSKIEVYQQMWSFMSQEANVSVATNEEGVKRVRESFGKYAFLLESPTNEYTNEQKPCDTVKVGSDLDSKGYGIATPRGSDLSDFLNMKILILRENGELAELRKKWWLQNSECGDTPPYNPDSNSSLKFSKLAGIFYILIFGVVLGFLVALVEFIYVSITTRHKSNFCGNICRRSEHDQSHERREQYHTPQPSQGVLVTEPELILLEEREHVFRRRCSHI